MTQDDVNKPTEYFDPLAQNAREQPGGVPGWSDVPGAGGAKKTEVLRPKGPKVFAVLIIIDGPGEGQIFRLDPTRRSTIGRDYACDIVIDESTVSKNHAVVKLDSNDDGKYQFFIQDLASENGTELNGAPMIKQFLTDGDLIKIGRATLVFKQV